MSIRVRLLISYIAMLIVPVFLFLFALFIIGLAFIGDIENITEDYQVDFKGPQSIKNLMNADEAYFTELTYVAKYAPQKLEDPEFLREMDRKLSRIRSGLIIRKEDRLVYTSPSLKDPSIIRALLAGKNNHDREQIKIGQRRYSYKQYHFLTENHKEMSIYILRDLSPFAHIARRFFPVIIVVLLLVLAFTNGLLTYLVSRSILKPLNTLKRATERIKEGNLDFQITPTSNDELGELSLAFEKMRQKLKESIDLQLQYEENRKELLSNISHDLKTPITAIKGYVEGIRDGVADTDEKREKYLSIIARKAEDMDRLIDELFLFSKLDLKKLPFTFEHVEIMEYLSDSIEELKFDLEKHGIEIRLTKNIGPACVIADREKLKRVIMNVIGNSVKYMNKTNGRISVNVADLDDKVRIQIEDNGSGIDPEALPYIFDRFYRTDKSRSTLTGGSGLGLAIAKQIIEEHGGEIWAESEPNKGTVISFTLKKVIESKKGVTNEKDSDY
nr:HAMP domain-containing sensor histidine kinase [Lihuaxuella thermophila]